MASWVLRFQYFFNTFPGQGETLLNNIVVLYFRTRRTYESFNTMMNDEQQLYSTFEQNIKNKLAMTFKVNFFYNLAALSQLWDVAPCLPFLLFRRYFNEEKCACTSGWNFQKQILTPVFLQWPVLRVLRHCTDTVLEITSGGRICVCC